MTNNDPFHALDSRFPAVKLTGIDVSSLEKLDVRRVIGPAILHVRHPSHQLFEQHTQFKPRQCVAQAEVRSAAAEGLMRWLLP